MSKKAVSKTSKRRVDKERRGILAVISGSMFGLGASALGLTGAVWTAGTSRFMMPNVLNEPPNKFKVGFASDFPPHYVETRFKEQFGVWIVRGEYQGKSLIYALRTACTHLGCITIWQENERVFKCPCHGSGFYQDGVNYEGPAPRPMERYAIAIADDGQLEVDKSRLFQKELGQWSDPACYVVV